MINKQKIIFSFFLFFLLMKSASLFAQTFPLSTMAIQTIKMPIETEKMTIMQYQQLPIEQQQIFAQAWHLEINDYADYLKLIQTPPNNYYYADKHLDPSWILGFNAKDDNARKKYALIAISNERARIDQELAFQKVFSQLQKEIYPNDLPIRYDLSENLNQTATPLEAVMHLFHLPLNKNK